MSFLTLIDQILIFPYRLPGDPIFGWWLGTICLALYAVILGDVTLNIAVRVNRAHIAKSFEEVARRHTQSMNALKAGDKKAYKEINKLANEAYGKTFFMQMAIACSSLWPVPFALAWMQTRFSSIEFPLPFHLPLVGGSVKYPFIFIPLYIALRVLWGKFKKLFK